MDLKMADVQGGREVLVSCSGFWTRWLTGKEASRSWNGKIWCWVGGVCLCLPSISSGSRGEPENRSSSHLRSFEWFCRPHPTVSNHKGCFVSGGATPSCPADVCVECVCWCVFALPVKGWVCLQAGERGCCVLQMNILVDTGSSNFAVAAAPHPFITHFFNTAL